MNRTKKVLVFTQFEKWENLSQSVTDRIENRGIDNKAWSEKYPSESNPIKKWDWLNPDVLIEVGLDNIAKEEGVFLVWDSINDVKFGQLISQCENNELYVLTHTSGRSFSDCDFPKEAVWLKGMHEPAPNHSYNPVFEILTDDSDNKLERIINEVFQTQLELETVLLFLHGCLCDSRSTALDESYQKLCSIPTIQDTVTDFYNKYFADDSYNGQNGGNKTADLATLRNKLLEYVSIQA